jgi:hypothetical protein
MPDQSLNGVVARWGYVWISMYALSCFDADCNAVEAGALNFERPKT